MRIRARTSPQRRAKVEAQVMAEADRRIRRAAIVLESEMVRNMGSEGGGVKGVAPGAINRKKTRNVYYSSPPGSFPGVRTGRLRRSITWQAVAVARYRVGTNVRYGRYLEFGTGRMPARPWAMRSFIRARARMKEVAGRRA